MSHQILHAIEPYFIPRGRLEAALAAENSRRETLDQRLKETQTEAALTGETQPEAVPDETQPETGQTEEAQEETH